MDVAAMFSTSVTTFRVSVTSREASRRGSHAHHQAARARPWRVVDGTAMPLAWSQQLEQRIARHPRDRSAP